MIKNQSTRRRPEINLSGPEENVFVLIGYAKQYAKQLNLDGNKIRQEMMSSDYDNAVATFEKYFGDYVDIIKPDSFDEDEEE